MKNLWNCSVTEYLTEVALQGSFKYPGGILSGQVSCVIIHSVELKFKEKELIRLNKIITQRADHLEMHNENILRSINTGIITFDTECKISSINRSASRILGLDIKNDIIEIDRIPYQ